MIEQINATNTLFLSREVRGPEARPPAADSSPPEEGEGLGAAEPGGGRGGT